MCCVQIPKPQCCNILLLFLKLNFLYQTIKISLQLIFIFFQFITSFGLLINSLFLRIQSCTHQDITSQQSALKSILKVTVAILQPFSLCSGHNKPFLVFNATILSQTLAALCQHSSKVIQSSINSITFEGDFHDISKHIRGSFTRLFQIQVQTPSSLSSRESVQTKLHY